MGKLMEFLMNGNAEPVTSEVTVAGIPYPFVIKSITEGENKALRQSCQKVSFDRRTHQKTAEVNQDQYNNRLVAACCVEPNFKDAELQKHYGVLGEEALIDKLLKPGQFIDLLLAIQEINGFGEDMDELRDEAKN